MKNSPKLRRLFTMVFLLTLLGSLSFVYAGASDLTPYRYPQKEDSLEWKAMSRQQRVDACQIPEGILSELSTEDLVTTILAYPMRADVILFDSYRQGFLKIYTEFNGLRELAKRQDAGLVLLAKYKSIYVNKVETMFDMQFIEILLAQPEILSGTPQGMCSDIDDEAHNKQLEKLELKNIYSRSVYTYFEATDEHGMFRLDAEWPYTTGTVETPAGTSISTKHYIGDITDAEKRLYDSEVKAAYPNVTIIRTATIKYNCHSYAWFSTSPNNTVWMPYPWNSSNKGYMNDGSYLKKIGPQGQDKIFYPAPGWEHSGIVTYVLNQSVAVTSKWGPAGLISHLFDDCPYYEPGYPVTFWRLNPNIPPIE